MNPSYVYALYHEPTKSYVMDSGYYGNCFNVACYSSKADCEKHIAVYYRGKGYRPKRMKIKQSEIGATK